LSEQETADDSGFAGAAEPRLSGDSSRNPSAKPVPPAASFPPVSFDRHELREIMKLYGRKVAHGEWRDYALDFTPQRAIFSIFRRTSETPLFRIEKDPSLARKQGAYAVIAATGHILKRGHDLQRVLSVLEGRPKLVLV